MAPNTPHLKGWFANNTKTEVLERDQRHRLNSAGGNMVFSTGIFSKLVKQNFTKTVLIKKKSVDTVWMPRIAKRL